MWGGVRVNRIWCEKKYTAACENIFSRKFVRLSFVVLNGSSFNDGIVRRDTKDPLVVRQCTGTYS